MTATQQLHVALEKSRLGETTADLKLLHLLSSRDYTSDPKDFAFEQRDRRVAEILIAYSLLNLDRSQWLKLGLSVDTVSLRLAGCQTSLDRWKPHVSCSLVTTDDDEDENAAVLSFGLLLMEMQAERRAEYDSRKDKDWETDKPSKHIMLSRILGQWTACVDDQYKEIAAACLDFRELSEKFYDPSVTQEKRRTAAMYKYILAPLYRLVTGRFEAITLLFDKFPRSASRPFMSAHHTGQTTPGFGLKLFDDETHNSHNP